MKYNMNSEKLAYITVSDEGYSGFLEQLCKSHKRFSEIPLICLTVNYEPKHIQYDGFSYLSMHDEKISMYDLGVDGSGINSFPGRIERLVSLKCKMLEISTSLGYDHLVFLDADCILNRNTDDFFRKMVRLKGDTKFPISTFYRSQWSTTHTNPNRETGGLYHDERERLFSYLPLHNFYGTEFHEIWYKTTFCMYFNKNCGWFFKEANEIIFDESIPAEKYKYIIPQEDETVFNYLYSKYNFHEGICFTHTSDIFYNVPVWRFKRDYRLSMMDGVSSLYHVKYHKAKDPNLYDDNERNLVDPEGYDMLIEELESSNLNPSEYTPSGFYLNHVSESDGNVTVDFHSNLSGDLEIICCSKDDPTVLERFHIPDAREGFNYYILHPKRESNSLRAYFFIDNSLAGLISY